jgi:DNA (cytosine-5)-methyltransferase 1
MRTIDLFCGAGGSSFGASNAGAEIVAGFDIWDPAVKTFRENFKTAKVFHSDIRKLDTESVKDEIGKVDLILASPECTNHSNAKGAKDRCEISKRTAFEVIRFANTFKPNWIIIENVVQMRSWSEHPILLEQLWDLGYFVKETELNSKDFGVPQSRRRLFLMCSLSDNVKTPRNKIEKVKPASSIIDFSDNYKFSNLFSPKRAKKTIERAERAIEALGKNEPFLIVYYGSDGSGGWQSIDKPLRTITTLDRFAFVKPSPEGYKMRMLQPEELKLAMGYSKEFKLSSKLTRRDKIKLMGNGVCPPVMEAIVNCL